MNNQQIAAIAIVATVFASASPARAQDAPVPDSPVAVATTTASTPSTTTQNVYLQLREWHQPSQAPTVVHKHYTVGASRAAVRRVNGRVDILAQRERDDVAGLKADLAEVKGNVQTIADTQVRMGHSLDATDRSVDALAKSLDANQSGDDLAKIIGGVLLLLLAAGVIYTLVRLAQRAANPAAAAAAAAQPQAVAIATIVQQNAGFVPPAYIGGNAGNLVPYQNQQPVPQPPLRREVIEIRRDRTFV